MNFLSYQGYFQDFYQMSKMSDRAENADSQEIIRCRTLEEIIKMAQELQQIFNKNESGPFGENIQVRFLSGKARMGLIQFRLNFQCPQAYATSGLSTAFQKQSLCTNTLSSAKLKSKTYFLNIA